VSGLADGTSYRVVLSGFADPSGNPLDTATYLEDGALDFTTGPDLDRPGVSDANPSEGQVDVDAAATETITVRFDEAMDTTVTDAVLSAGAAMTTVAGTWSAGGTQIDFDVRGRLARNAAHRLALTGFRDTAGNLLDPVPHVGDGVLDFVTGVDIFAPYVGFTDPVEGATDVSFAVDTIVVVFSESMDTSVTSVTVSDGTSTFAAAATWSLAGTRLEVDVANRLYATRTYTVDFRSFRDAGGTLLDAGHSYLGDGVLEFTLADPTGENCQDALTVAEATSVSGGVTEWVLAPGIVTVNDGSNTCPGFNTPSVDAVIHYRKTTPAASAGGAALRIFVESHETASTAWMSVAVLRGECDPTVAGLGPARLRCVDDHNPQVVFLDVGPGDYYIWVSRYSGSDFRGANVRVQEVAMPPEGDTCVAPYTTATGGAIYAAPATASDPHVWTIPAAAVVAMDHAVAYNGPGAMICDYDSSRDAPDRSIGADAVVRLPKASATSVGYVLVEPTTTTEIAAEILDRCDATDPAATSLACEGRVLTTGSRVLETTISGAAGDYYVWLATGDAYNDFPGAIVRYKEIEPGPGDTCATAIPLTVGATTPVTPNRPHRLGAPSCFARTENVTWYRFTTTERFTQITADAAANVAAIRAVSGTELACQASAASNPLIAFLPTGTDVCVAVASGPAVTSLRVDSFPYAGNEGAVTNLGIGRPLNDTGGMRTITLDVWMSVTPTTLYMGVGTQGVLFAPKSGGSIADFHDDFTTQLGSDAVAIGESLFSLDNTTSATMPRLFRLVDGAGSWGPTPWDVGSAYAPIAMDAMAYDGTNLVYATDWSATQPTRFYSHSPATSGPGTLLGMTNLLRNVAGIAADATYFYVVAQTDATAASEGVYRLPRSDLGATPVRLAAVDINTTRASIEVDDLTSPGYLYFRAADGAVHVIADPAAAMPRHLGAIRTGLDSTNASMTYDRATGAIYLFETTTASTGNFVRLD
jgi:hypothetical protein